DVLVPEADRLRLVILVHMPLDDDAEQVALSAARAIVTTSEWTRRRLLDRYGLTAERVHVATPGVDPARLAPGSPDGTSLICVAAVPPHKGYDVVATDTNGLPEALGRAPDGSLPGLLLPPDDPAALGGALRRWLTDADLRRQLRGSARARRTTLTGWAVTAGQVAAALGAVT